MQGFTEIVVGCFMLMIYLIVVITGIVTVYAYYDMNRLTIEPIPEHTNYINEFYPYARSVNFTISFINTRAEFKMNGSLYTILFYYGGSVSEKVENPKDYWR